MAIAMALTVAQTVFATIDSQAFKEVCSMFGYKSQLEDLKSTMSAIRSVLLDAELKEDHEPLDHATQDWINKLKDAVYDVDDLLDEFNTLAQRKKLMDANHNKISKKVSGFFSRSNELVVAFKMYRDIKKNNKRLDAIASDRVKYGFNTNYQPRRREETVSFVYEEKIIGRDSEKEEIVSILVDTNVDKRVSFVTIVGMGGLGKTTLAQLVYNDGRIDSMFKELRLWVCVSDDFSMESILKKLLCALNRSCDHLRPDQLRKKVQEEIGGKRYLLVLDDVWEESRFKWVELIEFLDFCGNGSKILVTCRSKNVAKAIGYGHVHELQGLSDDDSWQLFKRIAFGEEEEHVRANLVDIGKDIVKKCCNVPLCIKVIGSLLFGQDTEKWSLFQKNDLSKIQNANDVTMEILKFSYFHLPPQLKSCFTYCALFPKDCSIFKKNLIDLWMANGCIVLETNDVRRIEDVGEEYFSILLHRCFFQEIEKGYDSEDIVSCKVHDLIHDLALKVAGHEVLMLPSMESRIHEKVRHIGCTNYYAQLEYLAKMKMIRTLYQIHGRISFDKLIPDLMVLILKYRCLRFLDLRNYSLRTVPRAIGTLIHLRYLDLSNNKELTTLPESITNLINLQQLKLDHCRRLQTLPKHFSRLVNLRHLGIAFCQHLTIMPRGLKNLSCLQRLTDFKLGGNSEDIQMSQLGDLKALVNLRGELGITINELSSNGSAQFREGTYLLEKQHLNKLKIEFGDENSQGDVQEALLEGLQPHHNLQSFYLRAYQGAKFPIWVSPEDGLRNYLPRLAHIEFVELPGLHHLPTFSRLSSLKYLKMYDIPNLEYMENGSCEPSADLTFFPSLEELVLYNLPRLKRWWKDSVIHADAAEQGVGQSHNKVSPFFIFPRLQTLEIEECPNMKLLPPCPHLKELSLHNAQVSLSRCLNLKSVLGGGIEYLSCLRSLSIGNASAVDLEDDEDGIPWTSLHTLLGLTLTHISEMKNLPKGIQYLTALRYLKIRSCSNLSGLPEWLGACTSLQSLSIWRCKNVKRLPEAMRDLTSLTALFIYDNIDLENRCQNPNGEDWPKISHIPNIRIYRGTMEVHHSTQHAGRNTSQSKPV